jgi:primosomal protein N' (replication factor Y) (superfamily II helicase)
MDHAPHQNTASTAATHIVDVLVPVALNQTYSYRVPRDMDLKAGDVVGVPLGPREVLAVVWADHANPDPRLHNRLKDVAEKLDVPPLKSELRAFVDWVANYTLSARGMVLRMCLRMGEHLGPERVRMGVRLVGEPPRRLTPARRRVIDLLSDGLLHGKADLAKEAGVSAGVIDGLVDEGTLATETMPRPRPPPPPDPSYARPDFTRQQGLAVDAMRGLVANGGFQVALLDGVTGSGKTEVYFEAVAETIRGGKQSLILMPEIALTGQFLDRFVQRFGVRPIEWHSELSPRTRQRNWAAISSGEAAVVVGARSALFLPYADLGLIIVDEEHDQSYKQDEGVHYHARDMAVVRAHLARIPIVLASATPSVETEVNARKGRYQRIVLPQRFGGQHMPQIEAIDLRREAPQRGRFISPRLAEKVQHAVARREQALLFLNRRGYAPLTLCRACGHRFACNICDAWLVDHRFRQRLVCHHCGFSMPRPHICPHCAAQESFVAVGPGVERLQEEAAALFPAARNMVLSSDLITSIETMRSELNEIAEGRVDIIIGTQLVAKGHHFPAAQSCRGGRCRSWPEQWRSACRRAHLAIAQPGDRPRRARPGPWRRLSADPSAGPSGDAGADRLRSGGVLCERDRCTGAHRLPAVRTARKPDHLRGRARQRRRLCAQACFGCADQRACSVARAGRSAACGDQGPLPVPPAAQIGARLRPVGLCPPMAWLSSATERQSQAGGRCRSAELFVTQTARRHGDGGLVSARSGSGARPGRGTCQVFLRQRARGAFRRSLRP